MIKNLITAWDNIPKRVLDFNDESDAALVGKCLVALMAAMPEIRAMAAEPKGHYTPSEFLALLQDEPKPAEASAPDPATASAAEKGDNTAPDTVAPPVVESTPQKAPPVTVTDKLAKARATLAAARAAKKAKASK